MISRLSLSELIRTAIPRSQRSAKFSQRSLDRKWVNLADGAVHFRFFDDPRGNLQVLKRKDSRGLLRGVSELQPLELSNALSLWCGALAMSLGHGGLLLGDAWALRSHLGVQFLVGCPLAWQIVFVENGRNRAFRNAGFAVDAFIRVNEENRFAFVEALDRANNDAVGVLAVKAWFGDDMSHLSNLSDRQIRPTQTYKRLMFGDENSLTSFDSTIWLTKGQAVEKTLYCKVLCHPFRQFPDRPPIQSDRQEIETESRKESGGTRPQVRPNWN